MNPLQGNEGYVFEELEVGMAATFAKTITEADVVNYAGVTGDFNPVHVNDVYARNTRFHARVAHGMISAGLISATLGMRLPGPGAIYASQQMRFHAPVFISDTVTARVEVTHKDERKQMVTLSTTCTVGERSVLTGEALVWVPRRDSD